MPRPRALAWLVFAASLAPAPIPLVAAASSDDGSAPLASPGCSLEPLQVLKPGLYVRVGSAKNQTFKSCSEFTGGACPYTVPFPGLPCMVNCAAREADCVRFNRHTPGVNPFENPYLCASCSISACEACEYPSPGGGATCKRCFAGFSGRGGSAGRWEQCVLWDQGVIELLTVVLSGLLFVVVFLLIVTTAVGAVRGSGVQERQKSERTMKAAQGGSQQQQPLLADGNGLDAAQFRNNVEAIRQGLEFSVLSSIKLSSMRKLARLAKGHRSMWRVLITSVFDSTELKDMGIGLFLFFNTQKFFIVVAFVTWMVSRHQGHTEAMINHAIFAQALSSGQCPTHPMDIVGELVHQSPRLTYASSNRINCLVLWVILLFLSWGFYYFQHQYIAEYDRRTHSAEDYTLRLQNLPAHCTSEHELQQILEKEFRMPNKIHGVCICYNILALEEKAAAIEHMIENITEKDTFDNGWCSLKACTNDLERTLERDKTEFIELIRSGKLQASGEAYVVFKKQRDMVKVQEERRGIRKILFEEKTRKEDPEKQNGEAIEGRWQSLSQARTISYIGLGAQDQQDFVEISATHSEPPGIRWYSFLEDQATANRRNTVWMPLRMFAYIGLYSIVAQMFYSSMIRPWQNNFIEGAEGSVAVNLVSKLVILFNFAIQTMVMVDVERFGNYKYLADIDRRTFLWNTLLLVITNMYLIMQECYRDGIRWDMKPLPFDQDHHAWYMWQRSWFQSANIELSVAKSLAGLMTEQILMLYILGEIANVLGPVIFYWVALRAIFLWNVGGGKDNCVHRALRGMLPEMRHKVSYRVTARLAERAQILVPLLLWMEYTYIVVFAWMAFCTFFLATDQGSTVCGLLFGFSLIFYIWQRYVMLWLYGKATYDSEDSFNAFNHVWGCVLGFLPPIAVWWTYRIGEIREKGFAIIVMVMVFALATLIYQYGVFFIDWRLGQAARHENIDAFDDNGGKDPGYGKVMEQSHVSWWNMNPIYVLKSRHCPNEQNFEVHDAETQKTLWPSGQHRRGFFELGKEFRHEKKSKWEANLYAEPS